MTDSSMALALSGLSFMMAIIWGSPCCGFYAITASANSSGWKNPAHTWIKMGTPQWAG